LKIAALTCSFNRKEKTVSFLASLFTQPLPADYSLDIYLLDDNSSDGTSQDVAKKFPAVKLLSGTGSLYWAGGMRKVWSEALKDDYDFYILFNDDVRLSDDAIPKLISAYDKAEINGAIILGSVRDFFKKTHTYGGRKVKNWLTGDSEAILPDEIALQTAEIGNANIMLVDRKSVEVIGILSSSFTHGLADFDYTLRAVKQGLKVLVAPGYFGYCTNDHGKTWLSGKVPLKKRIQYLYSPTGLAYKEYLVYVKSHFPKALPFLYIKLWVKTLFPLIYDWFKKD